MDDVSYRQMRAVTVGLTQVVRVLEQMRNEGWVLLDEHITYTPKTVRMVFGHLGARPGK